MTRRKGHSIGNTYLSMQAIFRQEKSRAHDKSFVQPSAQQGGRLCLVTQAFDPKPQLAVHYDGVSLDGRQRHHNPRPANAP
jgi:hypothetical protein